ncbi:hypothetical protein WQQ_15380 [Hydrocarboniphaga effusa AP103]|uniref:Uncharacterized protein n=1 Tax=Hydrocarboniphaga effusa AP103 TaxID=1172194 RepID=I8I522_9GAMM|nr:hypothetical protein WQQ_15380 [Hydrocarboniphaga effusa AP103]
MFSEIECIRDLRLHAAAPLKHVLVGEAMNQAAAVICGFMPQLL